MKWLRWLAARGYYLSGLAHRYWGNARANAPEYEAAVADFTRALTFDPAYAQAYLDRGILYWREINHPRKALLDLDMALTLNPALHEARFNRGVAYQQLGEYARAIAEFQAYLAVGEHPYWREYAEKMVLELGEWVPKIDGGGKDAA